MQEREHEVQSESGEHFAPPDFAEPELVAPLHDRREREVGGRQGETLPVHADHSVLASILQHRTRRREQQKSAEENQRSGVPAGDQMHRRPERDPPQDGMARDAQDTARLVHVPDRALLAHCARVADQRAAGDEHQRHGHQHHRPRLEFVPNPQTLAWMIWAYARAPYERLWVGDEFKAWAVVLMPVSLVLIACGALIRNPSAVRQERAVRYMDEPRGILRVTRHPILWGIAQD